VALRRSLIDEAKCSLTVLCGIASNNGLFAASGRKRRKIRGLQRPPWAIALPDCSLVRSQFERHTSDAALGIPQRTTRVPANP
jgi:hypothetical protein